MIRRLLRRSRWLRQLAVSVVILAENGERVSPRNICFVWGYAGEQLKDSAPNPSGGENRG